MIPLPPKGSTIEVIEDLGSVTYRWRPVEYRWLKALLSGIFTVWLIAWAAGLVTAIRAVGSAPGNVDRGFLMIWITIWLIGGAFACGMLSLVLRSPRPETLTLHSDRLELIPGVPPVTQFWSLDEARLFDFNEPWRLMWKMLFPAKPIVIQKSDLPAASLTRDRWRQRLTIDHGADRIEIGSTLREPEREWLAEVIQAWNSRP